MVKLNRNERRATQKMIIAQLTDENKRLRQALDSLTKEVAATTEAFNNYKALAEFDAGEKWIDDSDREEFTRLSATQEAEQRAINLEKYGEELVHGISEAGGLVHSNCQQCIDIAADVRRAE